MQGRSRVSIRASPSASGGACTSGDLKQHAGAQGTGTSNHRHWQACMGRHAETLCLGARSAANKGGSDFDITLTQQERLAKHRPLGSALHRLVCSSPPRPWRSEGANRALPCRFWTPASMVRPWGGGWGTFFALLWPPGAGNLQMRRACPCVPQTATRSTSIAATATAAAHR